MDNTRQPCISSGLPTSRLLHGEKQALTADSRVSQTACYLQTKTFLRHAATTEGHAS